MRDALHQHRHDQDAEARRRRCSRERMKKETREGGERQAGGPARVDLAHEPRRERRQEHRHHAARRGDQPGPGGDVAHPGLQPERLQQVGAEEDARSPGRRPPCRRRSCATSEQRQVDDRVLLVQLPDQPGDEADDGDDQPRRRSAGELNQSASLPVSSMTCSAPTQTSSRHEADACRSAACGSASRGSSGCASRRRRRRCPPAR